MPTIYASAGRAAIPGMCPATDEHRTRPTEQQRERRWLWNRRVRASRRLAAERLAEV